MSASFPVGPRRFRMWRHLSSYRTQFQASSGNSDSENLPGYEAALMQLSPSEVGTK